MKLLTKEELYKKNQKIVKTLRIFTPVVFWGFMVIGVCFILLALVNSFGNISEITKLLDTKKYNAEQIQQNYIALTQKYGEWVIGSGNNGFTLVFIDIKNAVFSGVMVVSLIFGAIFILASVILGKWVFPALQNKITQENQDMVNLTILKKEE